MEDLQSPLSRSSSTKKKFRMKKWKSYCRSIGKGYCDFMELKILYDNEAKRGFMRGWGFSCLVGEAVLFDTGADINALRFNMQRFDVNFERINQLVLSHQHGDHVGGIQILKALGKVEVFVPQSFTSQFKRRLSSYPNVNVIEVSDIQELSPGLLTTGELGSYIKEQSLIIKKGNYLTVITGCSHPGLSYILRVASTLGEIFGVVVGFHGFSKLEALKGIQLIVPCHCTIYKRQILMLYPESSRQCSAGCRIDMQ